MRPRVDPHPIRLTSLYEEEGTCDHAGHSEKAADRGRPQAEERGLRGNRPRGAWTWLPASRRVTE